MSQSWLVTVEGQAYGPYPIDQMQAFIAEGRIVADFLVSQPGASVTHVAAADPVLGPLLSPAAPQPAPASQTPAHEATADETSARKTPARERKTAGEPATMQRFGRHPEDHAGETSHFVVVSDMKSRSINGLEEAIFNLGHAVPVLPQMWLLTTTETISAVRNTLVQKLGTLDVLFVIDTTHDKAAWHNFGPEADTRIRRFWERTAPSKRSA